MRDGLWTRRHLLRAARRVAVAIAVSGSSAACARTSIAGLAAPRTSVDLSVLLFGIDAPTTGRLVDFLEPCRAAVQAAKARIPSIRSVTFLTGNYGTARDWFPAPSSVFNQVGAPQIVDDPSIPMPDVLIGMGLDAYAIRALDLGPYIDARPAELQGVSSTSLRLGRAYAAGRGTFQALLPLLRQPPLALLAPGVTTVRGDQPVTARQFLGTLAALSPGFRPPSAPLGELPYAELLRIAVVGSGGRVAVSTSENCQATFAEPPAVAGLQTLVAWSKYVAPQPFSAHLTYAGLMTDDRQVVLSGKPFAPPGGTGPDPQGWELAPIPAFGGRPVVESWSTICAMVFRHTAAPAEATRLALALAASEIQASFISLRTGLALRPSQAEQQLRHALSPAQGIPILADPANDITDEDAVGTRTDKNAAAQLLVLSNLASAVRSLVGTSFSPGPAVAPAAADAAVADVLAQAQAASNAGRAYP